LYLTAPWKLGKLHVIGSDDRPGGMPTGLFGIFSSWLMPIPLFGHGKPPDV
jgi:hypothetical protein